MYSTFGIESLYPPDSEITNIKTFCLDQTVILNLNITVWIALQTRSIILNQDYKKRDARERSVTLMEMRRNFKAKEVAIAFCLNP